MINTPVSRNTPSFNPCPHPPNHLYPPPPLPPQTPPLPPGRSVRLPTGDDPLREASYLAVAELAGSRDGRTNDVIRLAAPLTMTAIKTHLASEIRKVDVVFWAPASKAVLGRRQEKLGSLVLSEAQMNVDDERALPVLFQVGVGLWWS